MVGETIGSYVIERRLGEGGMGTVYAARHTGFGRRAAVKVLRAEHSEKPEIVQRFFNEARAAAAIDHAGIVQVLDVGTTREGRAFLVMELLDGEPLSARLRGRTIETDVAVRIARQIADALAAAHARGIIHRDLKPDNVFLVRDPEVSAGERVKLLDFGIAKLHADLGGEQPETQAGALFGTPIYMAPEQCRGAQLVDHRADLYALGCILYEMLCGRPPFQARGVGDLLAMQMFDRPVPPRQLAPRVPAALEATVLRLLAKDPDERHQSAREVIADLGGETAPAMKPGADLETLPPGIETARTAASTIGGAAGERATEPTAPRRRVVWPWIAGAVVLAAAAAAFALTRGGGDDTPVAAVTVDAAPPLRAPELGLDFVARFATAHGSALAPYHSTGAWESAAHDFEVAAAQPGAPTGWHAAALATRGWAKMFVGDDATAAKLLDEAAAADPDQAWIQVGLASTRARTGDQPGAITAAHEAQRLAPHWWQGFAAEARAYRETRQYELAIEHYRRALGESPDEPALEGELALVYHAAGLDDEAAEMAERALKGDPDLAGAHLVLAERALERHDGKTALAEADRVVAIDPRSATGQAGRADALLLLGRKDEAKAAFEKALAIEAETDQRSISPERKNRIQRALIADLQPTPRDASERSNKAGEGHHSDKTDGEACLDEVACLLTESPPVCCKKYRSHQTDSQAPSGGPEALDATGIKAGMAKVRGAMQACAKDDVHGVVKLMITVSAAGRVVEVTPTAAPDDDLAACAARAANAATFARSAKGATFTYPISF